MKLTPCKNLKKKTLYSTTLDSNHTTWISQALRFHFHVYNIYATFNYSLSSSCFHISWPFFFVIMIGYWIPTSKCDCQSVYSSMGTSLSAFVNLPIKNRKTDSIWDEPNFSEKKSYNYYDLSHVMFHFIPLFSSSTLTRLEFWDMPLLVKWKKFILCSHIGSNNHVAYPSWRWYI